STTYDRCRSATSRASSPRTRSCVVSTVVLSSPASCPFMRLAIDNVAPFVFVLLRVIGAVIVLAPVFHALRMPLLPIPGERLGLFWVGQLQVTGFLLFAIVGLSIEAPGRAIVLAYTFSLW